MYLQRRFCFLHLLAEIAVESLQNSFPIPLAGFHIVQFLLHIGSKLYIDNIVKALQHQRGNHFAQGCGRKALIYLVDILTVLDRGHDGCVGRRSAHALFLHGLNQGRLSISGGRLGEVLLFADIGAACPVTL